MFFFFHVHINCLHTHYHFTVISNKVIRTFTGVAVVGVECDANAVVFAWFGETFGLDNTSIEFISNGSRKQRLNVELKKTETADRCQNDFAAEFRMITVVLPAELLTTFKLLPTFIRVFVLPQFNKEIRTF